MAKGYKIFPRSKAFRDNWDETFGKKPKWNPKPGPQTALIIEDVPVEEQLYGGCRGSGTKTDIMLPLRVLRGGEIKGITE